MARLSNRDAARSGIEANDCFMSFKRYALIDVYMTFIPIELWVHLNQCVYDHHSD